VGARLEVTELDLSPPAEGEALVRLRASGLCHSDLNAIDGTAPTRCRAVLGHEGARVVEQVGAGVTLAPGTPVVLSWLPACGQCEECLRELNHLCSTAWEGMASDGLLDGRPRLARAGDPIFHYCFVSSFAERGVVPARCCVPIPRGVPFEIAALVGCAITAGTGAVWRTAAVRPGDRVCVLGCGGVGMRAVRRAGGSQGRSARVTVAAEDSAVCQRSRTRSAIWSASAQRSENSSPSGPVMAYQ
jgi:Zn-dependent alcohol dehydrogenase